MNEHGPRDAKELTRLIDIWSEDEVESRALVRRLRRMVGITALAMILDNLDRNDGQGLHLVLKGGAAMEVRFGVSARTTRDVDALANLDLDDAFNEIRDRLSVGWEGFTGSLGERTAITRAKVIPSPQRCEIKLKYRGKGFTTLKFELGQAEASSFGLVDQLMPAVSLDRLHLGPVGEIAVLGVHYQIAQKIHACTEPPTQDESNHRVHDMYDILLLQTLAEVDGLHKTRLACEDTFRYRSKHSWPPSLLNEPAWPGLWTAMDIPEHVRIPYLDARNRLENFISRIAVA